MSAVEVQPDYEKSPFQRGSGDWSGVVTVERPVNHDGESMCKVMSARTLEFNGRRAIVCEVPYGLVGRYFDVFDGEEIYVYAEFKHVPGPQGGHIEFYEKASQAEYFLTAGGADRMYPSHLRRV